MPNRRSLVIAALSLTAVTSIQAWSLDLNLGSGERVRGSGEITSEARDLGAFDAISLAADFKVLVRQGNTPRVELKADSNLLPLIETRIVAGNKGRTLEIAPKRGYSLSASVTPQITLEMAQLRAISIAGSGEVRVEAMHTPSIEASIAGSGDIQLLDLNIEHLALKVSGSGDIMASGRAASLKVSVAGSGDVRTRALEAEDVKVSIAGSGDVQVQARKQLSVSIAGSGDVGYAGAPEISTSVAGSGKVHKLSN